MTIRRSGSVDRSLEDVLAATWLTYPLPVETRARLAGLGRLELAEAGAVLMREGEPNDVMAILLEGRVALRMRVPERGQVTIMTVEPGDVVGWSAVVPPFRATSTAVVIVGGEMAIFDGPTLRAAFELDPELAAEVYPLLLNAVARRLEGTRLQLLDLFTQRWTEPW